MNKQLDADHHAKLEQVRRTLKTFEPRRLRLIPMLQIAQRILTYLPSHAIELIAEHLHISPTEVYGVATFYNQFRFTPPGRRPVRVCLGTACHVKGAEIILEHFERRLKIHAGETTPDHEFSIDRVACVGCCSLAPVALVGENLHGQMMTTKVEGLILRATMDKENAERNRQNNELRKRT